MTRQIDKLGSSASPPQAPAHDGAAALVAQLFRQLLRLPSRNERTPRTPLPDDGAVRPDKEGQGTAPQETVLPLPGPPPADAAALQRQARVGGVRGSGAAEGQATADGDDPRRRAGAAVQAAEGVDAVREEAPPEAARDEMQRLARDLERLCVRGAQVSQHWSATLDLDPQALPQTRLRVEASSSWMRLRFTTQSAESVRMIETHAPALQQSLERSLNMPGHVDVDFE